MSTADHLLLASASPRRRRLLAWLRLPYAVCATDTLEEMDGPLAERPTALACSLAADKSLAARACPDADSAALVVACDTIVVVDGRILGKPRNLDDAFVMLRTLSGRMHEVVTGVALLWPGDDAPATFSVVTPVMMRTLTDDDIRAWANKGELLGCAGAYNIESHLASVALGQCFQNVAGLPLCHLFAALDAGGLSDAQSPVCACDDARGVTCTLGPRLVAPCLSSQQIGGTSEC